MSGSAYEAGHSPGERDGARAHAAEHRAAKPDGADAGPEAPGIEPQVIGIEPEIVDAEPAVTAVVRGVVPVTGLREFFDTSFRQLTEAVSRQRIAITGPAFGFYREPPGQTVALEVGFVTARAIHPEGDVAVGALPGGRVAQATHHGSFDGLGASWSLLHEWVRGQGLVPGPAMWEFYVTEPTPEMAPRDLRTQLNCSVSQADTPAAPATDQS